MKGFSVRYIYLAEVRPKAVCLQQLKFSFQHSNLSQPSSMAGFYLLTAYPKTQILTGATLQGRACKNLGFRYSDRY